MPVKTALRVFALAILLACYPRTGTCAARLPGILSSHMVLQRDKPIHIWGWSDPGEKVAVEFHGVSRGATGDSLGKWSVFLPPESAGGPYQVTVTAGNKIVLDDILIGDVWFASGQSNMEFPLKGFPGAPMNNSAEEIAHASQPQIRLLHIREKAADFPLFNSDAAWTVCSPETAANFSAVAYFFGRELNEREHVPIGLIDSTWGGTVAEAWTSLQAISADAASHARLRHTRPDDADRRAKSRRSWPRKGAKIWPPSRLASQRRATHGTPTPRPGLPPRCSTEWSLPRRPTPSRASSGIRASPTAGWPSLRCTPKSFRP